MRIQDLIPSRKVEKHSKSSNATSNNSLIRTLFSTEMLQQEKGADGFDKEIDMLRKDMEAAGEKLENEPTIPNFRQFRDILSSLAKRITTEAYRLEKCGGTSQNPRYFEIITTINGEADKLYNLIIQEQKNNMAITAKVIGIKGLVVDLIT